MKRVFFFAIVIFITCKNREIKKATTIDIVDVIPKGNNLINLCSFENVAEISNNNFSHLISSLTTSNCLYYFYNDVFLDTMFICKVDYNRSLCQIKAYNINIIGALEKKAQLVLDSLNKIKNFNIYDFRINFDFQMFSGIDYIGLIVSANHNQRDTVSRLLPKAVILFDTALNLKNMNIVGRYPSVFYTYNGAQGTTSIFHSDTLFIQDIGENDDLGCIAKNEFLMNYPQVDTVDTYYYNFVDPYTSKIVNGFVNDNLYTLKFKFPNKDIIVDLADLIDRYKFKPDLYFLMHNGYIINNVFYSTFKVYDDEKSVVLNDTENSNSFIVKIDMNKPLNTTPKFYKFSNIQIESLLPTLGGINFIYYENQHSTGLKLGFLN